MKMIFVYLTTMAMVLSPFVASAATLSNNQNQNLLPEYAKGVDYRFKRQSNATTTTTTTTTARPRKNRPSNIFSLISVLISETRNDTSRAFSEIGNLFNSQFSETTPKPTKNQYTMTTPAPQTSDVDDADNDITTTTEPYRISRQEFFGLLRSNVEGLRRLFQKELRNALRDTGRNAQEFGKEFRNALLPYIS